MAGKSKNSSPYLKAMEASIDGMAILDSQERYSYVNRAHAEIYGYSGPEELIGQNWRMLYGAEELQRFQERVMPFLREFGTWRGEAVGKRKDGSYFSQELSLALIEGDGLVCVVRDIEEHKLVEDALLRSQERLTAIVESQQDIIFEIDAHSRFTFISPACEELLGYNSDEMLGRSATDFMAKEAAERTMLAFQSMFRDQHELRSFRVHWRRRDGGSRCMSLNARPVKLRNGLAARGTIRDITELIQMEMQLRQAQKMDAVGSLAGGIAHDFNNILTSILGHASLLKAESANAGQVAATADMIEQAAQSADMLTKQLLGFARPSKSKNVAVDIHGAVDQVLKLLGPTFKKHLEVETVFCNQPIYTVGDPTQIEQVLLNLALNARDAVEGKSNGKLKIITKEVYLNDYFWERELAPGPYVKLSFVDNGCGIDPDNLRRVFDPFFTTKPVGKGTGMGLAMVYGIVKSHGGNVYLSSQLGVSTTLDIFLPLYRQEITSPRVSINTGRLSGKILLVDDEDLVRDVGSRMLQRLGYSVVDIGNGVEALQYFKEHKDEIDLVMLDLKMPKMDGTECFEKMRRIKPAIKSVLTSGCGFEGVAQSAQSYGIQGFIQKPYQLNQLSEVVARVMANE